VKILHITKKYPNALGGDAIVVSSLEKQQIEAGHKVTILTSNCDEIKNRKNIYKFGLKDTPTELDRITIKRLFSLIALFFKAYKVFKIERPDVIHTHSADMAFFISHAARHYRIPIVHSFHIVTFYDKNQSLLRRKSELMLIRGTRPKVITAPNSYDAVKLREAGLEQTVLLPYGIDLAFWRKKSGVKKAKVFTFVSVGRLEEQKGYEYLIRAIALLEQKTKKSFEVIIVGKGSLQDSLEALTAELNVKDRIFFIGRKTPNQLKAVYSVADAAIIPSLYETVPLTLLEAWAMGLPTVATPVGILAGAADNKKSILEIERRSPESLAAAMHTVMAGAKALVKYAHHKVNNYSWKNTSIVLEGLYESV
jgi:glycosyltransferase involved in cell wall biosynthesis